jgi:hypothetical protein
MLLIVGLLCLAVAGLMYSVMKLYETISNMKNILKSMNYDLNMVSKTMENMHKHEKQKELAKQIILG